MNKNVDTNYTSFFRQRTVKNGVLVDVSSEAKKHGITYSVNITAAVWNKYIACRGENGRRKTTQEKEVRLFDVLGLAATIINTTSWNDSETRYSVNYVPDGSSNRTTATFKMVRRHGDGGGFVVTIMLPEEN